MKTMENFIFMTGNDAKKFRIKDLMGNVPKNHVYNIYQIPNFGIIVYNSIHIDDF